MTAAPIKLLLVDDEPDILEFLSYNFNKNNFKVFIGNNGEEGMQQAIDQKPDIIITDILMPKMNGIEMCIAIKNNPYLSSTPIIYLSAVNDDYKIMYAMSIGANQIVSKPVKFDYLLHLVKETLALKV